MEGKVQAGETLMTQEFKTYQVWDKWCGGQDGAEEHSGLGPEVVPQLSV